MQALEIDLSSSVVDLHPHNFDDEVTKGTWLIEFMAPWCGYCRRLERTYEKVATELKVTGSGVRVAKVDGSAHRGETLSWCADSQCAIPCYDSHSFEAITSCSCGCLIFLHSAGCEICR